MERKKVILIVDDDKLLARAFFRRIVGLKLDGGYTLIQDSDPKGAAEEAVSRDAQYFLLTDTEMPGMTGLELIRELRLRLGDRLKCAVLMSGNPDYRARASEAGANMFLAKPAGSDAEWQAFVSLLKDFIAS